jgi:hypothetical protein
MSLPAPQVVVGEEDLGDVEAVFAEQAVVGGHELALTDGGTGLELGEGLGALFEVEDAHAGGNGAGGDEDDLGAGLLEGGNLGDEGFDAGADDAAADFDDEAVDAGQCLLAELHWGKA